MIIIYILLLFTVLYIPLILLSKRTKCYDERDSWKFAAETTFIIGFISTSIMSIFIIIFSFDFAYDNVKDIAEYRQKDNLITQYDSLMNIRLGEMKDILVEQYPQYEKEIFNLISQRQPNWLWEKYPEMKVSETMQRYISEINSYTAYYQNLREEQLQLIANIESRKNNPFLFTWIIPTLNNRVELEIN